MIDSGKLFHLAWRAAPKVPEPLLRGLFTIIADAAWLARGGGVRQLERNLARVKPQLDARGLRRLSRAAMRSYLRYYREVFALPGTTMDQVDAAVRVEGLESITAALAGNRSVVLALGHMGNWDLAGAYATRHFAPILTVAERLKPDELFQEFLAFRESLGLEILPLGDHDVFRSLMRAASGGGRLIPLLADRDLTARGIEVDLFGRRARVAAGPGALAAGTGAPLLPVGVYYERLSRQRAKAAGTSWGIVFQFHPPVTVPDDVPRAERVAAYTQGWVDGVAASIAEHPQDWHMLQKVFVEDLDPERYARTLAAAGKPATGKPAAGEPLSDPPGTGAPGTDATPAGAPGGVL